MRGHRPGRFEPLSAADRAFLAMDRGPIPEHLALAMVFTAALDPGNASRLLARRAAGIPVLRRRLSLAGVSRRPCWIRAEDFDVTEHVEVVRCGEPGDDQAMVDAVLPYLMRPLPRDRPLWRAVLVTGLAGGRTALTLIVHHAVVDGMGGLAVLARLLDGGSADPAITTSPRATGRAGLAPGERLRRMRTTMAAAGGLFPVRAEPCSLLGPTGRRRCAVTARIDLSSLRASAHRHDATVNAALLVAVAEALGRLLDHRGERIGCLRVAVPVAGPRTDSQSGNAASPLTIGVPVDGPSGTGMRAVAAQTRRDRRLAAGPAPVAVLGGLFRLLAATGGYQWYMRRQRRVHTVVTDLRGPAERATFGGVPIGGMIPFVVGGATDITVSFQALSYAGTLTVTAIADPDRFPDLRLLGRYLRDSLAAVAAGRNG